MVYRIQRLCLLLMVLMQLSDFSKEVHGYNDSSTSENYYHTSEDNKALSDVTLEEVESALSSSTILPEEGNPFDCPCQYVNVTNTTCSILTSSKSNKRFGDNSKPCTPVSVDTEIHWNLKCDHDCQSYPECDRLKDKLSKKNETCMRIDDKNIVMEASCPSKYGNQDIKEYCESFLTDLRHDVWLMTPVTDSANNVTYKNVFCAACNNHSLKNIDFWELHPSCFEKSSGVQYSWKEDEGKDTNIISKLYPRKFGYWKYRLKGKPTNYVICFLHPKLTREKSHHLRCCEPFCGSKRNLKILPADPCSWMEEPNALARTAEEYQPAPIILNSLDKSEPIPKFSRCDDQHLQLENQKLYDILCTDGKARCKFKLGHCSQFLKSNSSFDDPSVADLERYFFNHSHIVVCGPEVNDSISCTWMYYTLSVLLFFMRAAIAGLIVHELVFLWLPAKSTMDKNLGGLGLTLLIQNVCALYGGRQSCRIITLIWHYCMLSSFTWILIFSYDCWLSLHQLFKVYQLIGEYDLWQFIIYFAVSQIIPLLVTSAALFFGSSPADLYCQQDLGLDRYECLLAEVPGFKLFFLITATLLFALNIYYLVRIGRLVFPRQLYLKEARQKFKNRSGFAMMMSPTWMLGSLMIMTHSEMLASDILICIVHILQTISFLLYAFSQWLERIMQKYEEIERDIFGELEYDCHLTSSVLPTEDRQLLDILEGRRPKQLYRQGENQYLHS